MTNQPGSSDTPDQARYVDTQTLSDTDTYLYETIATLEYAGKRIDRGTIADAADLDEGTIDEVLLSLTSRGLLTMTEMDGEKAFAPARRDWSTAPDRAAGHPMS